MIDLSEPIIPGLSSAGISIGKNIADFTFALYEKPFKVEVINYKNPSGLFDSYVINNGVLKINTLASGEIISLSCGLGYQGHCKNTFYPGISVGDILLVSKKQNILNGVLIVDRDFGFYFPLPSPYDEIASSISDLPTHLQLNTIHIENIEWWIRPELTPSYARGT